METPQAYPLQWPAGSPRSQKRTGSQFKTSLSKALNNVEESIRRFGSDTGKNISSIVLSSNCALGSQRPADPGVAVWFIWDNEWRCIPVDKYPKPECNLQAIHHVLEARRTEFRHGGLHIAKAAFTGFTPAIEGPDAKRDWRSVMGFDPNRTPSLEGLKSQFRKLSKQRHPDSPSGSEAMMQELNTAFEQAKKEIL